MLYSISMLKLQSFFESRKNDNFDIKASNNFFGGWCVLEIMHESNRISKDIISSQRESEMFSLVNQ